MVHRALGFALSLILSVAVAPFGVAQVVAQGVAPSLPQPLTDTVSDFAGVLDATVEARLQRLIAEIRAETGVEVRVATMADIADHGGAGTRLDDYATALFAAWGLGDPERRDSILMLVATNPREARIALGDGYDAIYDGRAARVLSSAVLPDLRQGQIGGAIEAGLFSIRDRLIVPFLSGKPIGLDDGFESRPGTFDNHAGLVAFAGVAGVLVFLFFRYRRKRKTCPHCGAPTLTRSHEVIEPATRVSSGTGLEHRLCASCGFTDRRSYSLRRHGSGRQKNSGWDESGLSD